MTWLHFLIILQDSSIFYIVQKELKWGMVKTIIPDSKKTDPANAKGGANL